MAAHYRSWIASLVDVFQRRAEKSPDATAFVFVPERGEAHLALSYLELHQRAYAVSAELTQMHRQRRSAVLLFPPGLEFVVAFLGCLGAGVIAVPLMVPRRTAAGDSSAAIIANCAPRIAMTTPDLLASRPDIADRFSPKFALAVTGMPSLLNPLGQRTLLESVHVALHRTAAL